MAVCQTSKCKPLVANTNYFFLDCAQCAGADPDPPEHKDWEALCDEVSPGVVTTYFIVFRYDESGAFIGAETVDGAGQPYTPISPVPCPNDLAKTHVREMCWKDATNCSMRYTQLVCVNLETGAIEATFWLSTQGAIISPPANVLPCDQPYGPYMAQATGQAAPIFQPFNSFVVMKPSCCELTVTTSAGVIVIPEGPVSYASDTFGCLLTSINLSGACVAETTVIVNRTI